ncbi:hypothetical protein PR202_gb05169 [Eleusine coracana subsp. coracana]|uniref:Uncharacterized protein n=1 Tax=Eleusine coracana subsp. coracana TaxID=191504 RepID=A0AAV5E688_ELECO|nr:hypothetical protein PR202_gb05169 [Eleusine coracana subsp. coracana]
MGRAPCCDKASVKRGPWSPEEDDLLRSYVQNHGTGGNWIALPHKAGLNRCGKSCRLRWLNYLRPDIKHGGYTEQEDRIICSLYSSIGSRWSIIASKLPGRTDNDVKNYWNTKLKKKALAIQQPQQPAQAPQQCASSVQPSPASASSSGGDACSFGGPAMYSSHQPAAMHQQAPATLAPLYVDGGAMPSAPSSLPEFSPALPPPQPTGGVAINKSWINKLLGAGEFPIGDHLFGGGGFGSLLLQDHHRAITSSSSLQAELSACYFPNAQAEMWADVKPPAGLCHSLT